MTGQLPGPQIQLAALLLPTLTSARQHARSLNFISNLRQIGIALQDYVQENGSFLLVTDGNGLADTDASKCLWNNDNQSHPAFQ